MRMSEKRKQAIYDAINDPIFELRMDMIKRGPEVVTDRDVARLVNEIWYGVAKELGVTP